MAHRFLEEFNETLTVRELRDKLRRAGAIGETERPKTVPLTHYLTFKYDTDWHILVNASQGDNSEELARAQKMLDEVNKALAEAEKAAKEAKIADAQKRSEQGGVVSRNKAKAELAQLQSEDPL